MSDIQEMLASAALLRDADLRALEHVDGAEFKALIQSYEDPITDGVECDHEVREYLGG